jgi:hypothetical protein
MNGTALFGSGPGPSSTPSKPEAVICHGPCTLVEADLGYLAAGWSAVTARCRRGWLPVQLASAGPGNGSVGSGLGWWHGPGSVGHDGVAGPECGGQVGELVGLRRLPTQSDRKPRPSYARRVLASRVICSCPACA